MSFPTALSYDDVLLVPKYSDILSRKEVDLSSNLDNERVLTLPIISSPMDTITESSMANLMATSGGLGIIHRYNSIEMQVQLAYQVKDRDKRAAAIGITGDYLERAQALYEVGVKIFCLDVAHGHHILMQKAIKNLKSLYGDVHIMAGNVATKKGFEDLSNWGADSIRCNIGSGSICSTRIQTGHGMPGLQTIFECFSADITRDVKIIADGGIKNSGDIVKALAAGADLIMIGSLLSGTAETPGQIIHAADGSRKKIYRGMASKEAQRDWKGKYSSNEGVSTTVPAKGSAKQVLEDLDNGIRSGLSYSGARDILELQMDSEFIVQTPSGQSESKTHIHFRK
jgi:IMP dehydrogenase